MFQSAVGAWWFSERKSNFKTVSNDFFVFVILSKECRLGIGELLGWGTAWGAVGFFAPNAIAQKGRLSSIGGGVGTKGGITGLAI